MAIALRYAARSDLGLGPKSRNEDSGYAGPNLLVLADGMGGHAAGDVASSMIVGELAPLDEEDVTADQAIPLLEEALHSANAKLTKAMRENSDLAGMGSTTIVMLRTGNKLAMAHIGDSRAFMLRGDTFSQITKDHSFVQQLIDEGRISKEDAGHHPQRSVVTRVMTGQPDDEPDTSLREAKIGDRFLMCSDGLSDFVGADVIEEILREARTPDEAADRCIEIALKASTRDNVTVIVAEVVDADGDDLPTTVPQVVGAAGKRMRGRTRAIPTSPAEKAAALSREATGRAEPDDDALELAEDRTRSRRSKILLRTLGVLIVAAILGGGGYAAWAWSQKQFFVAADAGHVAIFRGVSQDLGPLRLSHVESSSDVLLSDLPTDVQASVGNTIPARNLADAQVKVTALRGEAARCQRLAATGTPCGTTPNPSPSTVPTSPAPTSPTPSTLADPDVPGAADPATLGAAATGVAHDPTGRRVRADRSRRGGRMTTTVEPLTPRTRRGAELLLLLLAIAIVLLAWVTTDLNRNGTVPANIIPVAGGFTVLALTVHLVLRWKAAYADPVLLPITTVLNGLGLVMIHRLDLARGKLGTDGDAYRQLIWTTLAVILAVAVLILLRDHRLLRRYTFVSMAAGFVLLLLPLVPGIGRTINGSQIWITIGPLNFQPGEFAKIALAIFFAGYLVQTRDVALPRRQEDPRIHLPPGSRPRPDRRRLGPLRWSCSSSRTTSARHCSTSACSSRCSTSPPSACRGSSSACCSSRPPWPSPSRRSRTSTSASTSGSTPSRSRASTGPTSSPTASGAWPPVA